MVGVDIEPPAVPDDAAVDAEGTQFTAPVPEGGDSSHTTQMHTSADIRDDGLGKCKVGDEGPSEAVAEEAATPAQGVGCATALPTEGDQGDHPEPGEGDERRRSSNFVQRVKQRARSWKLAAVRLSPYRSSTSRRYGGRC